MPDALRNVLIVWIAVHAVAAAVWPARRWPAGARSLVLLAVGAGLFLVPWAMPREPLWALIFVAASAIIVTLKLRDLHVGASWWRQRSLGTWLRYLPMSFVLVLRRHVEEPVRPRSVNVRLLVRATVEVGFGIWLLDRSFAWDLGRHSFFLDHLVKLLAVYCCAFDGGLLFVSAVLRLAGINVMDFSREPITSVTPADFWRRYNRSGGRFLYENVYKPAGGLRPPFRGTLLTFGANGLLHEYLAYVLVGRVQGYQLCFFFLHGLAVALTFRVRLRGAARWVGRIGTFLFLYATAMFFFATVDAVDPGWFYPRGGLLP